MLGLDTASLGAVNKDTSRLDFINPSVDIEFAVVKFGMNGRISP
jgi:hypothetical protein